MNNLFDLIDTEQIYQHAPSGYLSMLPEGTIIKINQTLLNWLGYKEDAVVGKMHFTDLLSKGGAVHYEMFFRPMVSVNGNIKELNYELLGAPDKKFPALINANGVMDKKGKLLAINMVITDITQRNLYEKELLQAKNKLQAEKTRFELLADLSETMIWTVDLKGEVNYFNGRMSRYFNLRAGDPVTGILFRKLHPQDKKKLITAWHTAGPLSGAFADRIRFRTADGAYEWFNIRMIPVDDPVTDIKWFGTGNSINELVIAMDRKDEFIHIASHELNTPVTVLKGYLQLLQNNLSPETVQDFVSKSLNAVKNLQFLISSLLNVRVINSGELTLNLTVFSLQGLLQSCIDQLKPVIKTHTIVTDFNLFDTQVAADKERITQVIINLLNNAVKYSPGQKQVSLSASLAPDGLHAMISVKDNGVGIAAPELHKIFERYYRVKETQLINGLGLGLYITQNILTAHGSQLKVESEVRKGSVFSFELPVAL
ncbi:MAG: ATP-binding protein [Bacteroidota bacterium]